MTKVQKPPKHRISDTKGTLTMAKLLGGYQIDNVTLTKTQWNNLYKYYGFDPNFGRKSLEELIEESKQSYKRELERWEELKKTRPFLAGPKPKEADHEKRAKERLEIHEKFTIQGGDQVNLPRHIRHDGIRVMAYLSKFLEEQEDPVALIANALAEVGYADTHTEELWENDDEEEGISHL